MGSRVERARKLRGVVLVVTSLLMLLAYGGGPALAAQEVAPNADTASGYQYGTQPGPTVQPGVCGHVPGEFLVVYESEEALRAAPQENVVDTIDGILAQLVVYGGIKSEPDPVTLRDAEEAAKKELEARPGVSYVEYNCTVSAEASTFAGAAQAAAARALPADCGECGGNIGRLASEIIGGGSEGSDGKNAYQAALSAARSAGLEENVALASETGEGNAGDDDAQAEPAAGEDGEAGGDNVETDGSEKGTDDEGGVVEGDAAETAAETPDAGEEKDAGGEADASQEKDAGEETTSAGGSTSGGVTPGDAGGGDAENASANGGGLGGSPLVALGGGVLLVAGLFMARKIFGG